MGHDELMLAQEFVETSSGVDQRVMVVGGEVLFAVQRRATRSGEARANASLGGDVEVVDHVDPCAAKIAIEAAERLDLRACCGIDFLLDGRGEPCMIGEVNVSPGFMLLRPKFLLLPIAC